MMIAVYRIAFADIDYTTLARQCGVDLASVKGLNLTVTGSQSSIDTLSSNLSFGPKETYSVGERQ